MKSLYSVDRAHSELVTESMTNQCTKIIHLHKVSRTNCLNILMCLIRENYRAIIARVEMAYEHINTVLAVGVMKDLFCTVCIIEHCSEAEMAGVVVPQPHSTSVRCESSQNPPTAFVTNFCFLSPSSISSIA